MPKINLNELSISKVKLPHNKQSITYSFIDFAKLQLKLQRNKHGVSYYFQYRYYRPSSKQRNIIRIGIYPDVTLADVRRKHAEFEDMLASNIDPQADKLRHKILELNRAKLNKARENKNGIGHVFDCFVEYWPLTGKSDRTLKKYRQDFDKWILPRFAGYPMALISAQDWDEFILDIANIKKLPGAAANVHKAGRKLFSFAAEKGYVKHNPLLGRKSILESTRQQPNEVYMDSLGIHTFLNELNEQPIPDWVKVALELMLRVGVRSEEWTRVKLGHINWDRMRIEHPADTMKNGREAWTHLPENVISLLLAHVTTLKTRFTKLSPDMYLFFTGSPMKQLDDSKIGSYTRMLSDWLDFSPKIFRKTISTHLQEHGCSEEVLRAIRNQVLTVGVGKNYEFGDLYHMKKEWIERWQSILMDVKADKNALEHDKESTLNSELSSKVSDIFS